jgi:hypothetical protein
MGGWFHLLAIESQAGTIALSVAHTDTCRDYIHSKIEASRRCIRNQIGMSSIPAKPRVLITMYETLHPKCLLSYNHFGARSQYLSTGNRQPGLPIGPLVGKVNGRLFEFICQTGKALSRIRRRAIFPRVSAQKQHSRPSSG